MRVESKLYGGRLPAADRMESATESLVGLYDGASDVRGLWQSLLRHRSPRIQVYTDRTMDARLLAESHVAIPEPELFGRSLEICLRRRDVLLSRARDRQAPGGGRGSAPALARVPDGGFFTALILRFIARHVFIKLSNRLQKLFVRSDHWSIACGQVESADGDAAGWSLVPSPSDRFYADPFLWISATGERHLFFEEFRYGANRGVISHLTLDSSGRPRGEARTVLERPYHLSYPFVFEHEGQCFLVPETAQSHTVEIYRALPFPTTWVLHQVLLPDVRAVDTTLHFDGERWWMFTTLGDEGDSLWDELSLFHAESPFGPWRPHPMNPIVSDCRCARMAGRLFRGANGRLIRPAQDCEKGYGSELVFCEVMACTTTAYAERIVSIRRPARGRRGTHTWNTADGLAVTDVKHSRWRWGR